MNMNEEENFFQNEYKRFADVYLDICIHSSNNQKGMRVGDLRKKYKLSRNNVVTLLKCLNDYSENDYGKYVNQFEIYSFSDNDDMNAVKYSDFDSKAGYYEADEIEEKGLDNFGDDDYIHFVDNMSILVKKLNEDNIDIANASFFAKINHDKKLLTLWDRISDVSPMENSIILKGAEKDDSWWENSSKKVWINGIIQSYWCDIKGKKWKKTKSVLPLGLYFDYVLKRYKCVYYDEQKDCIKEDWLNELNIEENKDNALVNGLANMVKSGFDIGEHIKKIQNKKMVLKAYPEANVINKLKELLRNNQLETKSEKDGCEIFEFMTDDPDEYMEVFNEYGSSVLLLEPEESKQDVLDKIDVTLKKYGELMKKRPD